MRIVQGGVWLDADVPAVGVRGCGRVPRGSAKESWVEALDVHGCRRGVRAALLALLGRWGRISTGLAARPSPTRPQTPSHPGRGASTVSLYCMRWWMWIDYVGRLVLVEGVCGVRAAPGLCSRCSLSSLSASLVQPSTTPSSTARRCRQPSGPGPSRPPLTSHLSLSILRPYIRTSSYLLDNTPRTPPPACAPVLSLPHTSSYPSRAAFCLVVGSSLLLCSPDRHHARPLCPLKPPVLKHTWTLLPANPRHCPPD